MIKVIVFILFTLSFYSFAQTNEEQEVQLQMDQLRKVQDQMIKSMLDDTSFKDFDEQFKSLVKKFEQESYGSVGGEVFGEYDWRETETQQILVLKVVQSKDKPLDIKIEKGQIKFKGDVQSVDVSNPKSRKSRAVHFERSFAIPAGVDQANPEFENKAGELLIKFKKLNVAKVVPNLNKIKSRDQRRPISKEADDLTL